jgi:hypothetical protein
MSCGATAVGSATLLLAHRNLANTFHPPSHPCLPLQDDVPVPQDDTPSADTNSTSLPAPADLAPAETKPEPSTTDAEPAAQSKTTPQPADTQSKPQQASPAAADSEYVPSDKPMNQLRNMGGGSTPQPKTPKKWKSQPGSWFPDASGVQCPPG